MSDDLVSLATRFVHMLELEVQLRLDGTHLTLPRYAVLVRADGRSASELARADGISQQAMAKTVRVLCDDLRYLERVLAPDRRSQLLRITDAGQAVLAQAQRLVLPAPLVSATRAYVDDGSES